VIALEGEAHAAEEDPAVERRGHAFCRYADDCNIYVRSQAAGERSWRASPVPVDTLRLTVNAAMMRGSASGSGSFWLQHTCTKPETADRSDQHQTAGR